MSSSDPKSHPKSHPKSETDELEHLRLILRGAHKPNISFASGLLRTFKDRLQARFRKQAIAERLEKSKEEDAA